MRTFVIQALERLRQIGCGHEDVFRFGDGRVWVECLDCGRQTRGILAAAPKEVGDQLCAAPAVPPPASMAASNSSALRGLHR